MNLVVLVFLSWYLLIFITTEILSFLNSLERIYIFGAQVLFFTLLTFFNRKKIRRSLSNINLRSKSLIVILAILLLTFIQGILSAPSTTDSMVYHLPRVMYWIQEKTLDQEIIRNPHDFMPPFAEYILLHLYFIAGNDRLVFLSQWLGYVFSIYLSGIIFTELGGSKKHKVTAILIAATLPMALLQSVSTQTDMVTNALVLMTLYLSIELVKQFNLRIIILLGLSIGLGALTKPTFFIYLLIPLGIIGFYLIRHNKNIFFLAKKLLLLSIVPVVSFVLLSRFFWQNIRLYGSILGKHIEGSIEIIYINQVINPSVVIINLIRNLFLQIPFPFLVTPMQQTLKSLGNTLGIDINDPRITWGDYSLGIKGAIYPQEDIVSSPLHVLLIIIMLILLFNSKVRKKINSKIKASIFSLGLSFGLFSAVLMWQSYHSRLHLPFLFVGSILSVLVIIKLRNGNTVINILTVFSIILAFIVITFNVSRPYISYNFFYENIKSLALPLSSVPESFILKPRIQQYFNARYYWYEPYSNLTNYLTSIPPGSSISFQLMDNFEYPIWVLLKEKVIKIKVLAKNDTRQPQYLIKSSYSPEGLRNYTLIKCEKTRVDYGYICLYNHQD